jgi:hypothetical protein
MLRGLAEREGEAELFQSEGDQRGVPGEGERLAGFAVEVGAVDCCGMRGWPWLRGGGDRLGARQMSMMSRRRAQASVSLRFVRRITPRSGSGTRANMAL